MEQTQSIMKLLSEYQMAFKQWPWQPVRQSLKPENNKGNRERREKENRDRIKSQMERKSIYGIDYVPNPNPKKVVPKKPKAELTCQKVTMDASTTYKTEFLSKVPHPPKVKKRKGNNNPIQPAQNTPFHGDSIYMASYLVYDKETMSQSRQRPIKAKDNIEIPTSSESEKNAQSTAMGDFVRHENYARPTAIRPQENNEPSSEPVQGSTEYKDSFYHKPNEPHMCRTVKAGQGTVQAKAVSTVMSDFTWPTGFEQQKPCRPPRSNHFTSAKFDGTTTFNVAYKPWTVKPYELPTWAKKSKYKRPEGGMNLTSLYAYDFTDPKIIRPPKPIHPKSNQGNPFIKEDKDRTANCTTGSTYVTDFKKWEGSLPPESYRIMEVFTPPKENMNFETNHRSHFKGEHSSKRTLCRHVSQHRDLNDNTNISFVTTYNENFQNPRPKSSPTVGSSTSMCPNNTSRCASAETFTKIPVPFPKDAINANSSAESPDQCKTTNILKIHRTSPDQGCKSTLKEIEKEMSQVSLEHEE